jgi:hypothetical protein
MRLDWEKPQGPAWDIYASTVRLTFDFTRLAAPTLFMWIEWCALLALLRYAQVRTHLWPLTAIQWLLAIALWGYFVSLGATPTAAWKSRKEIRSVRTVVTIALSFAATAGLMLAAFWLADVFMENPL